MQVGALLVGMLAVALMGCTTPERIPSGVPHTATPSTASAPSVTATGTATATRATSATVTAAASPRDAIYVIGGVPVRLYGGVAEVDAAPSAASKVTTRYFGNEARGDLDGDGREDVVCILTQNGGGSGMFFYAAAALRTEAGWVGTNAILLGDRIAPQTSAFQDDQVVINYADRLPDEPMTARPSRGVSRWFGVQDGRLVERH